MPVSGGPMPVSAMWKEDSLESFGNSFCEDQPQRRPKIAFGVLLQAETLGCLLQNAYSMVEISQMLFHCEIIE